MRFWKPKKIVGTPKVGIAVASYRNDDYARRSAALSCLLHSFVAQTYQNWVMLVVHDGPLEDKATTAAMPDDPRIKFVSTKNRKKDFGHPHRQWAIDELIAQGCDWLGLTNEDNFYVPVYLEWMLSAGTAGNAHFVHCDMVHSHKLWKPMQTRPQRGHLDLGGFLVRADLTRKVKFDKFTFSGDGDYIGRLVKSQKCRVVKVPATLFVHN